MSFHRLGDRTSAAPLPLAAPTPSFRVETKPTWVSGQYLIKITRNDGIETTVPIVVREAVPRAPLLFQVSITTPHAYNLWGGDSLYDNHSTRTGFAGARAFRVSFDRPYTSIGGADYGFDVHSDFMLQWLEQSGYDIAYVTNVDIDENPDLLNARKLFVSVGHDEYWSVPERNAVEAARDGSLSLAFFSANSAYWRIRLDPSSTGQPRRIITCYKGDAHDPIANDPTTTNVFRSPPDANPENALLGVMYQGWHYDGFPLIVTDPSHWVFEGTQVAGGETISHVIGYEWDTTIDNGLTPTTLSAVLEDLALGATARDHVEAVWQDHPRSSHGTGTLRLSTILAVRNCL